MQLRLSKWFLVYSIFLFILQISTSYAQSQENGGDLFKQNCAVCHGSQGQGGVGVPLSAKEFINAVDDDYLRTTIRQGRVGRVMPAFVHLSENQVNAIIRYMRSWTGKKSKKYMAAFIEGDAANGEKQFKSLCTTCHGQNGEGGYGTGVTLSRPRNLPVLPPALNNPSFLLAAKDQVIKAIITNGHKGSPFIPTKNKQLTDAEINDIVTYIRSFERQAKSAEQDGSKVVSPVIVRESPYDLQTTLKNLKEAVVDENLRVIRVQNLDNGLVEPDRENQNQVIVYSCGFNFLYQALKVDPRIGLFLPCRVTVIEKDKKVLVMAINPKKMSHVFNNNELDDICDQMHDKYVDLIEGALL